MENFFYAFDNSCIQEVDNFPAQTCINILTTQTLCLNTIQHDLMPASLIVPTCIKFFSLS